MFRNVIFYRGGYCSEVSNVYLGFYANWGGLGFRPFAIEYTRRIMSKARSSSDLVILIDGNARTRGRTNFDIGLSTDSAQYAALRHSDQANHLYLDGHVDALDPTKLTQTEVNKMYRWGKTFHGFEYWRW